MLPKETNLPLLCTALRGCEEDECGVSIYYYKGMVRGRESSSPQYSFLTPSLVPALPILQAALVPEGRVEEVVQMVWDGVGREREGD